MLILALAVGLGIGILFLAGSQQSTPRELASEPDARETIPIDAGGHDTPPPLVQPTPREPTATAAPPPTDDLSLMARAGSREDPKRFEGRGEIRGEVHAKGGAFPGRWQLVLEPSRYLIGSDRAESRTLDIEGTNTFIVPDLPFAGYDIHVVAEGWNSRVVPLLLEKGSPSSFLNLELIPAGFLEGLLLTSDRLPAQGIEVMTEALSDRARRQTISDAAGRFRFDSILDGSYRLIVGDPNNPMVAPISLVVSAPGMALPAIELPPLGSLSFLVLGPVDEPIANVRIRGSGQSGGKIDVTTDHLGRAEVDLLPLGRYRVRAEHQVYGSRREAFDLAEGEPLEVVVRLHP